MINESMIAERVAADYPRNEPTSVLDEYAEAHRDMLELGDGRSLREAVDALLSRLPQRPVSLLASSTEGLALAAVCAALRSDGTDWQAISFGPVPLTQHAPVVVEPVDGGRGWRRAVRARYPGARFLILAALRVAN
jgi:hypothetical protein